MEANVVGIRDIFAPSFWRAWNDIYNKRKSKICLAGGRGSTKSSFIGYAIFLIMEMNRRTALAMKRAGDPNWKSMLTHSVVYRKTFSSCENSVYAQLQWCAEKLGLTNKYRFTKSPLKITRVGTGQTILFRGLDDPMKSRSIKFPYSFPACCWWEELSEFDGIEEVLDVARSVQRGGHDFYSFFSYNPPETSANWVNFTMAQMAEKDPNFGFYQSDYRTVPKEWLGDQFFHDAEVLRRINERAYRHVYLGEITGNGGTVFPNVTRVNLTDDQLAYIRQSSGVRWGCDFGLRDPTVLAGVCYDKINHKLIIFDEVYKPDMTIDDMEREFRQHHFGYEYIVADCAGATMIQSLRARGLQMVPCAKGAGSIESGIKWLQSLTAIEIDTQRCPNAYKEFVNYEYEKNKAGEFTGRLPDHLNHYIDACLRGNTLVATPYGMVEIKDIVGQSGVLLAYDAKRHEIVETKFCNVRLTRKDAQMIRVDLRSVTIENSTFVECTPDHRIMSDTGHWVHAEDLRISDRVCVMGNPYAVTGIRILEEREDVYDLEVPKYHNFLVNGGVVVHNCRYAIGKLATSTSWF